MKVLLPRDCEYVCVHMCTCVSVVCICVWVVYVSVVSICVWGVYVCGVCGVYMCLWCVVYMCVVCVWYMVYVMCVCVVWCGEYEYVVCGICVCGIWYMWCVCIYVCVCICVCVYIDVYTQSTHIHTYTHSSEVRKVFAHVPESIILLQCLFVLWANTKLTSPYKLLAGTSRMRIPHFSCSRRAKIFIPLTDCPIPKSSQWACRRLHMGPHYKRPW